MLTNRSILALFNRELLPRLGPKLIRLLPSYQHQPDLLALLTSRLIETLTLRDIENALGVDATAGLEPLLIIALSSPNAAVNKLGINLIHSYLSLGRNSGGIHELQNPMLFIRSFVHMWLTSPDTGVGFEAKKSLLSLLAIDPNNILDINGWKWIFPPAEKDLILREVMIQPGDNKAVHDAKTIAQARLLEALPAIVSINPRIPIMAQKNGGWKAKAIEYGFPTPYPGLEADSLIHMAGLHMVNEDDLPMTILLERFWEQLFLSFCQKNLFNTELEVVDSYGMLLAALISKETPGAQRISGALSALPGRFNDEDSEKIRNNMKFLLSRSSRIGEA